MKYLVFSGVHYYPEGGWHDFSAGFTDLNDAKSYASFQVKYRRNGGNEQDWAHIVNIETCEIIHVERAQ